MIKAYRGVRWCDGKTMVFCPAGGVVPGAPEAGFDWGNGGAGSQALAWELLHHHLLDVDRAARHRQPFLLRVVANLQGDVWILPRSRIAAHVREIEAWLKLVAGPLHDHDDVVRELG